MTDHPTDSDLVGYIARELSAANAARVSRHVAHCATCRAELEGFAELDQRLRDSGGVQTPADFAARILGRARPAGTGVTRRILVAAACALLAVGLAGGWVARATFHAAPRPLVRDADGARFMLVFVENLRVKNGATAEERDRANADFGAWFRTLSAGTDVLGGTQLVANDERMYATRGADTASVQPSTDEQMTGFIVVRAESHADVAEFARRCPIIALGGRVIVRQLRDGNTPRSE